MIPIIVGVVMACLFILFGCLRWRRQQCSRASPASCEMGRSNPPKPYGVPASVGHSAYAPPAPPPAQIPQCPPRGYAPGHRLSRSQGFSSQAIPTVPEPAASAPSTLRRPPSSTISGPPDPSPFYVPSSVRRDEGVTTYPPPSSPPPASSRSSQRNTAESPRPSSPPPSRNPFRVAIPPPASSSPPQPSNVVPPFDAARPLAPMPTGASTNIIDEPPPAYTPV